MSQLAPGPGVAVPMKNELYNIKIPHLHDRSLISN